ncbi:MAG: AAA family ATPase [Candidatus Hydrogenedentota bacterium]
MKRIHILGASGTGTTTLARILSDQLECPHFDVDDYFWLPTDPPYVKIREVDARQTLLRNDLATNISWTLSGSLCGWGDFAVPDFDIVVFLTVATQVRLDRLKKREIERFGVNITSTNDPMHK